MKKRNQQKLSLNRETVRHIDPSKLSTAGGGWLGSWYSCPTNALGCQESNRTCPDASCGDAKTYCVCQY